MLLFLGLILALLPTYLFRFQIFWLPTTFLELVLIGFLLAVLIRLRKEDLLKIKNLGQINYAVILFVVAAIVSTLVSPQPIKALGQLKAFIIEPILFFYAVILTVKKESDLKLPLSLLWSSVLVISLFGIIQYFTHLNLPLRFWGQGLEPKRITSVFEYPNALALYLAPLLTFFLTLYYKKIYFQSQLFLIGVIIVATTLFLTFSRGAWLAVLVGVLFLFAKNYSLKKVIPIFLILLFALALIPSVKQRTNLSDSATLARLELMKIGVNKVIDSPILGSGLYGFRTTLAKSGFTGEILNYPHNIFLNFWLELGLLGLLSFFLIINRSLLKYKQQPSLLKLAAVVYLITFFIHGLVDVPYFKNDLSVLFWFMIALFFIDSDTNIAN